jgi:SpoVK/Ycf46/Vps4 family AAA+-type ATPase
MARSDLVLKLVKSGMNGDKSLFTKTVEAMIAEESNKKHSIFAKQLQSSLKENVSNNIRVSTNGISSLLYEKLPEKSIEDIILSNHTLKTIKDFIEEQNRADLLRAHNIEPRNRILLVGPPGNGKTSLAEALASSLTLPFYTVQYEGIIGSYLGETANRLKTLFDFVRTQKCLIFFDEFDAIGKERGDTHETGEIKRVVSSLLLQIDKLPSYVVVVTATNHAELLDKAVWRRFQMRLNLEKPTTKEIIIYLEHIQQSIGMSFEYSNKVIAQKLHGLNFSEIEEFALDIQRKYVLSAPDANTKKIVRSVISELDRRYVPSVKKS